MAIRKYIPLLCLFLMTTFLEGTMSLQECRTLALNNSDRLSISELRLLIEDDRVRETWGMAYPQLSAEGQYVAAGDAREILRKRKTANARASLIVPIFSFGGICNAIDAQESIYEATFYDSQRVRQDVLNAVYQAYYRLLEANKIYSVVKESLHLLENQHLVTHDFFEQGLVHKNDVLVIEVQMAQREQDLIQAKHNIDIAKSQLNRLMGQPLDQALEIEDILEEVKWEQDYHQLVNGSIACHPDLLSLRAKIEASDYGYKATRGTLFPGIYFFSNYSTTNDYNFPYTHGLDAGIGMQVNLYDGGVTLAKLSRMKKELCELMQTYQARENDIELQIKTAFLTLESSASQVRIASKGILLAEENLKITLDQFHEGLVGSVDVLNDEERLAQARSNYYQALYDFHKAKAELAYAAGTIE